MNQLSSMPRRMPLVIGQALAVRAWWPAPSRTPCSAKVAWSRAEVVEPPIDRILSSIS